MFLCHKTTTGEANIFGIISRTHCGYVIAVVVEVEVESGGVVCKVESTCNIVIIH